MLLRTGLGLLGCVLIPSSGIAQIGKGSELEARLIQALGDARADPIHALAKDVQRLTEEQRRTLPFRVRPGAVEFRFQGDCPGHTNVEFVLSNKFFEYESLLVVNKADLERAGRMWKAIQQLAKAQQTPAMEFKLVFVQKGQARVEDLQNVFHKVDFKAQKDFYWRSLSWQDEGLRIDNSAMDPALVPTTPQRAEVIVIVRAKFLNP